MRRLDSAEVSAPGQASLLFHSVGSAETHTLRGPHDQFPGSSVPFGPARKLFARENDNQPRHFAKIG
jgi:hypothetical protein